VLIITLDIVYERKKLTTTFKKKKKNSDAHKKTKIASGGLVRSKLSMIQKGILHSLMLV